MKLLNWAMGLLLLATPASAATTLYSRDVPAGDMAALTIHYDGPASGFQQTFQLTYTGLTLDIDTLNRLEYRQDNILYAGSNDSTGVYASCVILRDGDSTCARDLGGGSPFPPVTFVQTATFGQVTFTITNPGRVFLTGCPGLESYCYTEHGYSDGHGTIRGMFAPGDGGHYEVVAFDPIAVPEPATWTLMMLGFGVAGLGLRTRGDGAFRLDRGANAHSAAHEWRPTHESLGHRRIQNAGQSPTPAQTGRDRGICSAPPWPGRTARTAWPSQDAAGFAKAPPP